MVKLFVKLPVVTVSQLTALFLCFWMSGVMCAVSCCPAEMIVSAETNQAASGKSVQNDDSCPMHKQAAKRSDKNSAADLISLVSASKNLPRFECCALLAFFTDDSKKTGGTDALILNASLPFKSKSTGFEQRKIVVRKTFRTIIRTRGDTYLRNCVFLI